MADLFCVQFDMVINTHTVLYQAKTTPIYDSNINVFNWMWVNTGRGMFTKTRVSSVKDQHFYGPGSELNGLKQRIAFALIQ